MVTNLFPIDLHNFIEQTWSTPSTSPHLASLISFASCFPWATNNSPYKTWLSSSEENRLTGFNNTKRQREWLAGRICAKAAIQKYCQVHQPQQSPLPAYSLHITNLQSGRPDFHLEQNGSMPIVKPYISISHSNDYAIAFVAEKSCGIDIQRITERILRVKERFCHRSEEKLLQSIDDDAHQRKNLTLLWAAKEAIKKAMSPFTMPGFLDLSLTSIYEGDHKWLFTFYLDKKGRNQERIMVVVGHFEDYGIGVCIGEDIHAGTSRG